MSKIGNASVYKFVKTGKIFIHSLSQIQMGVSIGTEPYIWLDKNASQEDIVSGLIVAMSQTKSGLPNPTDWASFSKEFIKAIGLTKQSDLYKGSILVGVVHKDGVISFRPMTNNGSKGFVNVPQSEIQLPDTASIEELGTALEAAFNKCE